MLNLLCLMSVASINNQSASGDALVDDAEKGGYGGIDVAGPHAFVWPNNEDYFDGVEDEEDGDRTSVPSSTNKVGRYFGKDDDESS